MNRIVPLLASVLVGALVAAIIVAVVTIASSWAAVPYGLEPDGPACTYEVDPGSGPSGTGDERIEWAVWPDVECEAPDGETYRGDEVTSRAPWRSDHSAISVLALVVVTLLFGLLAAWRTMRSLAAAAAAKEGRGSNGPPQTEFHVRRTDGGDVQLMYTPAGARSAIPGSVGTCPSQDRVFGFAEWDDEHLVGTAHRSAASVTVELSDGSRHDCELRPIDGTEASYFVVPLPDDVTPALAEARAPSGEVITRFPLQRG